MSKLAIQGLLAITSALWSPAQADSVRPPWAGDPVGETRQANEDGAGDARLPVVRSMNPDREH